MNLFYWSDRCIDVLGIFSELETRHFTANLFRSSVRMTSVVIIYVTLYVNIAVIL